MRGQIVQIVQTSPDAGPEILSAAREVQANWPHVPQLGILVAEIAVAQGLEDEAWSELRSILADPDLSQDLLRIAIAGLADSRLPDAPPKDSLRRLRLSVRISRGLLGNEVLPSSLEPRAHDTLVRSMLGVLDNQAFADLDESERADWLEDSRLAVLEMNDRYPGNRMAATAMLRLAEVYSDALGEPEKAIELFDAVAQDPSASLEHIQIARIGRARSYVVAGDTLRARQEFTRIGDEGSDPESQSRAHYHLGLLDFMGGEVDSAYDRFRAVARRAPRADYANDALDMAILLAEEDMRDQPDEDALRQYGVMLYQRATHQREAVRVTLTEIASGDPSPVRERSRMNLASLYDSMGDAEEALRWADRVIEEADQPRLVAEALDFRGGVLLELGRISAARESWERVLLEHEDYVMADRVRDQLAALRSDDQSEGEVP
jgi:tetratricopeptide (TPR) repeat protein